MRLRSWVMLTCITTSNLGRRWSPRACESMRADDPAMVAKAKSSTRSPNMPATRQNKGGSRRLLPIHEAAEVLSISERTFRGLIAARKIATIRVSNRRLAIRPEDLESYVARRRSAVGE